MRILLACLTIFIFFTSFISFASEVKYTCPMHPQIISDHEGNCPICGMELVPMESHEKHLEGGGESSEVNLDFIEKPTIKVSSSTIQKMGIRTVKVEKKLIAKEIRAFGNIQENIRERRVITSRAPGWVSELKISSVGDNINEGDLLYKIHSPEMSIAQNDYLLESKRSGVSNIGLGKLKDHYQFSDKAIEKIKKTQEKLENIPFYAKNSGVVSELMIVEGDYVSKKMPIAAISDYSSLWVIAEISEQELNLINSESKAYVIINAMPDKHIMAKIDYIYPEINMQTRKVRVRLVFDNPDGSIKVNSFADIIFKTAEENRLVVPSEAVLISSEGKYVVIRKGSERFSPRKVETGIISQGSTEVISGLHEGEEIVVSGQFMIDSESSLREALQKMTSKDDESSSSEPTIGGAHANH